MRSFIIATFLILGWTFYEMSGGSDFTPDEARKIGLSIFNPEFPEATPVIASTLENVQNVEPASIFNSIDEEPPLPQVVGQVSPDRLPDASEFTLTTIESVDPPLLELKRVTGSAVNMRAGPGTSYGVVSTLTRGTDVEVLETMDNGWAHLRVIDTGRVGWMAARFLGDVGA